MQRPEIREFIEAPYRLIYRVHPSAIEVLSYWLMLHAYPKPDSDDYGTVDAGWASCFVDTEDSVEAETRAHALIAEHGWDSEEVEELVPFVQSLLRPGGQRR